ncbi:hypothetical protein TREES_T100006466 [Tupaia chinensis]|uniref:Uncharacterized protein n=1 Tax=Tupaia chinensis TaxID=246437 RepID=L9KUU4_TUPCH|nr:hypothetical protein TREES_T100006466 [Tupaia chinensis]
MSTPLTNGLEPVMMQLQVLLKADLAPRTLEKRESGLGKAKCPGSQSGAQHGPCKVCPEVGRPLLLQLQLLRRGGSVGCTQVHKIPRNVLLVLYRKFSAVLSKAQTRKTNAKVGTQPSCRCLIGGQFHQVGDLGPGLAELFPVSPALDGGLLKPWEEKRVLRCIIPLLGEEEREARLDAQEGPCFVADHGEVKWPVHGFGDLTDLA